MHMPGTIEDMGIAPPGLLADSAVAKNIKGTAKAHKQPMPIVKIPNTSNPVERS
jgi:hypothetical protein